MELELNGRAGLLHIRRRRALVRSGLRRSRAHLARSRELDRPGSGMGPRLGRAFPRGARVPPLGTADAAHVRPSRSRAAPDRAVEPALRRSAPAGDPRTRATGAVGSLRRRLRLGGLQLLPRRAGQRRLARRPHPQGHRRPRRCASLAGRAAQVPAAPQGRRQVAGAPSRTRRSARHRRQDAARLGPLGPQGGAGRAAHQHRLPVRAGYRGGSCRRILNVKYTSSGFPCAAAGFYLRLSKARTTAPFMNGRPLTTLHPRTWPSAATTQRTCMLPSTPRSIASGVYSGTGPEIISGGVMLSSNSTALATTAPEVGGGAGAGTGSIAIRTRTLPPLIASASGEYGSN